MRTFVYADEVAITPQGVRAINVHKRDWPGKDVELYEPPIPFIEWANVDTKVYRGVTTAYPKRQETWIVEVGSVVIHTLQVTR